jgi:hypothetical protein
MARPRNPETNAAPTQNRISIPLTPDGTIQWDSIRGSTKERLLAVIDRDTDVNPDQWGELAAGSETTTAEDVAGMPAITEANVREGLDLLSKANGLAMRMACASFVKHPVLRDRNGKPVPLVLDLDIVTGAFTLTAEQHAELDPRALRLAQKNAPEWLKKNLDLYMLVGMYLKFTADNASKAMVAQVQRDVQKAVAAQQAATVKPVDSDVRTTPSVPQPVNGHAQPGNTFEGAPLEPGETGAIEPEEQP